MAACFYGDPVVRSCFEQTMANGADDADGGPFSPLDRFVMELFRTISPNGGSRSKFERRRRQLGAEVSSIITPPLATSMDPRHWPNLEEFDPDRYKTTPTSVDTDEARVRGRGSRDVPSPIKSSPPRTVSSRDDE